MGLVKFVYENLESKVKASRSPQLENHYDVLLILNISSKNNAQDQADCQLQHKCLVVTPGDLHTVVLTGAHHPHN